MQWRRRAPFIPTRYAATSPQIAYAAATNCAIATNHATLLTVASLAYMLENLVINSTGIFFMKYALRLVGQKAVKI